MRLIYIYIYNFGCIHDQGFNLSSDYKVEFSFSFDKENKIYYNPILKLEKINHGLPHLFHKRIVDIKGIIGENGAGKSTFLKYLSFYCHEHSVMFNKSEIDLKDILVYEITNEKGKKTLKICYGKYWQLSHNKINNATQLAIEPHPIKENQIFWGDIDDFYNTSFIYYSNVFDYNQENQDNGLINISTNYLVSKDAETLVNSSFPISEVTSHRHMERKRQIHFAINYSSYIPFDIPKSIKITIYDYSKRDIFRFLDKYRLQHKGNRKVIYLVSSWKKLITRPIDVHPHNKVNALNQLVLRAYLNYFVYFYLLDENETIESYFPGHFESKLKLFSKLISICKHSGWEIKLDQIIGYATKLETSLGRSQQKLGDVTFDVGLGDSSYSIVLQNFKVFYDNLYTYFSQESTFLLSENEFIIPLDNNIISLIDQYSSTIHITEYFNFSFPGLSSGELSFLTLFSRFYSLVDPFERIPSKIEDNKTDLIILMDEGDLYFHPVWQRSFLHFINQVLPNIIPQESIQIILTSHSQFLASDLPVNHLLFLKKGTDEDPIFLDGTQPKGKCIITKGPEKTFASNIHDLLSDSFFLKGAHIGEIAKHQIYKLIDQFELKGVPHIYSESEIIAIIENIGDVWLRNRLMEKFQNYKQNLPTK